MPDWRRYWNTFPTAAGDDPFRQVAKTVGGRPISGAQFQATVDGVRGRLGLTGRERVLDLCCGNGLLTARVAAYCREVVAVDFSEPLLAVARREYNPPNVTYRACSVLGLDANSLGRFDRVYMYEALQHFRLRDLAVILGLVGRVTAPDPAGPRALFGSVPDRSRRWEFYDTPRRKLDFLLRTLRGREAIGTWWPRRQVRQAAEAAGFSCEFHAQDPVLHTAHYRFDVTVS